MMSTMSPYYDCDTVAGCLTLELPDVSGAANSGMLGSAAAMTAPAQDFAFEPTALNEWFYETTKRLVDLGASLLSILVLSPLLVAIALAIKLSDFGPILFVQTRIGKNGKPFRFYKFRSMVINAEELKDRLMALNHHDDQRTFKMAEDPRITWVGRLIRRASLDELPQLFHILLGDMTLVGPRPPLPQEVALYSARDRRRLEVRPGLTCIWQVSGRANLPFREQVRLDIEYIERRNLLLDFKLLALTVPAVVTGRGAY